MHLVVGGNSSRAIFFLKFTPYRIEMSPIVHDENIPTHHAHMENILTPLEQERLAIISSCIELDIPNAEAAARLGLIVRQTQRLKRAVEKEGKSAIIHGNRGRTSNHAMHPEITHVKMWSKYHRFSSDRSAHECSSPYSHEKRRDEDIILTTHGEKRPLVRPL